MRQALELFELPGEVIGLARLGSGNIHDSYESRVSSPGGEIRLVHQRLNTRVFPDPESLMRNLVSVTGHLIRKLEAGDVPDRERKTLRVLPTRDGKSHGRCRDGHHWRTFHFIPDAESPATVKDESHAFEVGRALGEFQRYLSDFPARHLHTTLPGFHDVEAYYQGYRAVLAADPLGRREGARDAIDFVERREARITELHGFRRRGGLPARVVHWDPKVDNILMDRSSGRALCMIDLDTVAPSVVLDDVGDLLRSSTNRLGEDAPDPEAVEADMALAARIISGYLQEMGALLTVEELHSLPRAPAYISLELGLRFLADHLGGDTYFRVETPGRNLHRARVQFALARSFERQEPDLAGIMASP